MRMRSFGRRRVGSGRCIDSLNISFFGFVIMVSLDNSVFWFVIMVSLDILFFGFVIMVKEVVILCCI